MTDEVLPGGPMEALRVHNAAIALYHAGRWSCDTLSPEAQAHLWEDLRDALGLPAGTATAAGVGS